MSAVRDGEPVFINCVPVLCVCRCYLRVCTVFINMLRYTFLVITGNTDYGFSYSRSHAELSALSAYSNVCTGRRIAYKAYINNITSLILCGYGTGRRNALPPLSLHLSTTSTILFTPLSVTPNTVRRCGPQAVRFRPGSVSRDR